MNGKQHLGSLLPFFPIVFHALLLPSNQTTTEMKLEFSLDNAVIVYSQGNKDIRYIILLVE